MFSRWTDLLPRREHGQLPPEGCRHRRDVPQRPAAVPVDLQAVLIDPLQHPSTNQAWRQQDTPYRTSRELMRHTLSCLEIKVSKAKRRRRCP